MRSLGQPQQATKDAVGDSAKRKMVSVGSMVAAETGRFIYMVLRPGWTAISCYWASPPFGGGAAAAFLFGRGARLGLS